MLYHFGNHTLETDRRALSHSGTLRHLEPKVFDLLRYLVEQRARVVSRDELYAHVWGETHVSDASLSYCISAARKAVGDTGRTQHVIQTIHGRGYAFVAAVTVQPHEPTPSPCDASPPRSRGAVERSVMPTAEWRQLTVLWCCVSLTPVPARLPDAEERYQVLREVHTLYGQIVRRLQGYMAPSVHESYVSYFGYPLAYEDAACRAVYAGLDCV